MSGLVGHRGLLLGDDVGGINLGTVTLANLNSDLSDAYRTWTIHGDAAVSGGWLVLDGSGDYLSTPNTSDFDFGADPFCVEAFVHIAGAPGADSAILSKWQAGSLSWLFGINTSRNFFFYFNNGSNNFPTNAQVPLNTDTHITAYRATASGPLYAAMNGTYGQIFATPGTITTTSQQSCIGMQSDGTTSPFNGKIRGVRVTKGNSRGYGAANFTPPSFPLSA